DEARVGEAEAFAGRRERAAAASASQRVVERARPPERGGVAANDSLLEVALVPDAERADEPPAAAREQQVLDAKGACRFARAEVLRPIDGKELPARAVLRKKRGRARTVGRRRALDGDTRALALRLPDVQRKRVQLLALAEDGIVRAGAGNEH